MADERPAQFKRDWNKEQQARFTTEKIQASRDALKPRQRKLVTALWKGQNPVTNIAEMKAICSAVQIPTGARTKKANLAYRLRNFGKAVLGEYEVWVCRIFPKLMDGSFQSCFRNSSTAKLWTSLSML